MTQYGRRNHYKLLPNSTLLTKYLLAKFCRYRKDNRIKAVDGRRMGSWPLTQSSLTCDNPRISSNSAFLDPLITLLSSPVPPVLLQTRKFWHHSGGDLSRASDQRIISSAHKYTANDRSYFVTMEILLVSQPAFCEQKDTKRIVSTVVSRLCTGLG